MKQCPFCAEDIKDEAIKCKHCGSDVSSTVSEALPEKKQTSTTPPAAEETPEAVSKTDEKTHNGLAIGVLLFVCWLVVLGIFGSVIFFFTLAIIASWFVWKKTKLKQPIKLGLIALFFIAGSVGYAMDKEASKPPVFLTLSPENGVEIQATSTVISGTVEPSDARVTIDTQQVVVEDGEFAHTVALPVLENRFKIVAYNPNKSSVTTEKNLFIQRVYSEEEQAVIEQREAEARAAEAAERERRQAEAAAAEAEWNASAAGQICAKNPSWSREECRLVAENKIWIGMHLDMLKYMRGLPDSANPSDYGYGRSWQWCWHDYSPSCFYGDDDGIIDSYN